MSNAFKTDPNNGSNEENQHNAATQNQIKQIIGIMGAKGGVGKSFVTALLASELARNGFQVGILDADFTGPSIPMLFGLQGPLIVGKYSFLPIQSRSGIKIISLDLLVDDGDQSVIWRESLMGNVIEELWKEVEWGELDYLLLDLPPATSEVSVAIINALPINGVIVVTSPQKIAKTITSKAIAIAQKTGVNILGVVENMAYYIDPDSKNEQFLFGKSTGESAASKAKAPIWAHIPLDPVISDLCDSGKIEDIKLDVGSDLVHSLLEELSVIKTKKASAVQNPDKQISENISYTEQEFSQNENECRLSFNQSTPLCKPYSDIVMHLVQSKENMGVLDQPDAQGHFLGRCGDRMQIDLKIINNRIIEARYLPEGCGVTLACGSMVTKMACLKTLEQANQITPEELITALDGLPEDHVHCAQLAVMALKEALIDAVEGHRNRES
jgi:Mrp family chromosome partitioning ATPase/NifU-like protein involved in Fe-S cluster formation